MKITTITNYCSYWGLERDLFIDFILKSNVSKSFWVGKETLLIPINTNPFKIFNQYPIIHVEKDRKKDLIKCFKTTNSKSRVLLKSKFEKSKYLCKDIIWENHNKFLSSRINPTSKTNVLYHDLTFDNIIWGYQAFWVFDDMETNSDLELYYEFILDQVLYRLKKIS